MWVEKDPGRLALLGVDECASLGGVIFNLQHQVIDTPEIQCHGVPNERSWSLGGLNSGLYGNGLYLEEAILASSIYSDSGLVYCNGSYWSIEEALGAWYCAQCGRMGESDSEDPDRCEDCAEDIRRSEQEDLAEDILSDRNREYV